MKRFTAAAVLAFGVSTMAMAADFKGFVEDTNCASKPAMKDDAECARKCIKGGSPAVLLTADAKVYKLDDQAKAVEHAGHKVKVTGTLDGDIIKIESIQVDSGCVPGPTGCQ